MTFDLGSKIRANLRDLTDIYTRTVGKKDRQPTTSTRLVSYSIQTANRYDSHAINPTMTVNTLEKE